MADKKQLLTLGIHFDIPNKDYHADREYVSSSGLKLILKDPEAFYNQYVKGEAPEDENLTAFDFGSYVHALVLEPETIEDEFIFYSGTKRGKAWEAFQEKHKDSNKIIITKSQNKVAQAMMAAYKEGSITIGKQGHNTELPYEYFFSSGVAESSAATILDDVPVKARFDYHKSNGDISMIIDVKTTSQAHLDRETIQDICERYSYDLSAALYVDIAEKITGKPQEFYFFFMSKKPPYRVKLFKASKQMIARGREKYKKALAILRKARYTGIYYENGIEELL